MTGGGGNEAANIWFSIIVETSNKFNLKKLPAFKIYRRHKIKK